MGSGEEEVKQESSNGVELDFSAATSHPLKHKWVLWYDAQFVGRKPSSNVWGDDIKQVFSFDTVEDFWRLYNNVAPPSKLDSGCTYSLFKKGIEPRWEDSANTKGGKWTIIIQKSKGMLDRLWLWTILATIGQVLEEDGSNLICGAVVNIRKQQDKLCIWTRDAEQKEGNIFIGKALKKALELPEGFPLTFQAHPSATTAATKRGPTESLYEV